MGVFVHNFVATAFLSFFLFRFIFSSIFLPFSRVVMFLLGFPQQEEAKSREEEEEEKER